MFSEATEIKSNDLNPICSNIDINRLSVTPFVEKNILLGEIERLLTNLEKKVQLSYEEIEPLSTLVSLYYYDDHKDEYEFRLNSLVDLSEIENVIKNLEITEDIDPEEIDQLLSKISTCGHGPYRSLLENKLNHIKNKLPERAVKEVDYSTIVSTTNSLDELDTALCELVFEEYINLGKENRLIVCRELLKMNREKDSLEEISDKINRLIATSNLANPDSVNDNYFKDTVFVNELFSVRLL